MCLLQFVLCVDSVGVLLICVYTRFRFVYDSYYYY
jgi:hypothetical protein